MTTGEGISHATEAMADAGRHNLVTIEGRQLVEILSIEGGRQSEGQDRRPYLVFEEIGDGRLAPVGIHHQSERVVRTIAGELLPLPTGPGTTYPDIETH